MGKRKEAFTISHDLLLAGGSALIIALLIPITPSNTGSSRGLAELLIVDSS